MRKLVPCLLIGSLAASACGGNESSGGSDVGDGGMGGESAMGGADATGGTTSSTVQFLIDVSADVPGYPSTARVATELDEDATYSWELVSVPEASGVTEDDLMGTSEPEVAIVPDLGGDYVLELTVSQNGASASKTVAITPPTYDIPFLFSTVDDDGSRRVPRIVKSGGEAVRNIGCAQEIAEDTPEDWESRSYVSLSQGHVVRSFFPSSVSGTARMAYTAPIDDSTSQLLTSSSQTTCEGELQPVEIVQHALNIYGTSPRFSRSGRRMTGVVWSGTTAVLVTFGVDLSNPRIIKNWPEGNFPYQSTWLGADRIAWIEMDATDDYLLLNTAPDAVGAGLSPETLLDCTGVDDAVLTGLKVDAFGDVLYVLDNEEGQLWRVEQDGDAYDCSAAAESNTSLVPDLSVQEFELDPLGQRLVFAAEDADDALGIYLMPADGSDDPIRISPADDTEHTSPYWTLGGRQVIWTSTTYEEVPISGQEDMDDPVTFRQPAATRLYRANRDGSEVTVILEHATPGRAGARIQTGHQSCAFGPWRRSPMAPLAFFMMGAWGWIQRRRTERPLSSRSASTAKTGP